MEKTRKDHRRILADNLKELRSKKDWNQEDLAEAAGLSVGAVKMIETCVRWPRPTTLNALAKALSVSVQTLFMGTAEEPKSVSALIIALQTLEESNEQLRENLNAIGEIGQLFLEAGESDRQVVLNILRSGADTKKQGLKKV